MTREKLERWLQHAARLEAESESTQDEPVALGSPDAEPWTPREPDPFGLQWQWLDALVPGERTAN